MPNIFTSIKGRLAVAISLTAVLTFTAIGTTFIENSRVRADFDVQSQVIAPLNQLVRLMMNKGLEQGALLREQMLTNDLDKQQVATLKSDTSSFESALAKASRLASHMPGLASKLDVIKKKWAVVKSERDRIQQALAGGQSSSALDAMKKESPAWRHLYTDLKSTARYLGAQKRKGRDRIVEAMANSKWWSTGLLLTAMLLGGGLLLLTIVGTVRRIGSTLTMMQAATTGDADLSRRVQVHGSDEMDQIGLAFNAFLERIQGVIAEVSRSASMVSTAADEMSSMATQVKTGIEQQRSDTTQVAAAINEMNATAHEVARNIEETSQVSGKTADSSRQGAELATSAIGGMNALQEELGRSSEAVSDLSAGVLEIGSVVDLINQVADQTNLLALNAAIEAARAGEHGRGFAVVAEEVRSLAQKTQDATGRISGMIDRLRGSADSVVTSMDRTRSQSESASGEVDQVAESLAEINGMVRDIADRAAQVATAAEEQSAVAEEINRNVASISTATEQTSSSVEHSTGAANELSRLAGELNRLVAQFKGV